VVAKTECEFLKYRNFGKKTLHALKQELEARGLSLGLTIPALYPFSARENFVQWLASLDTAKEYLGLPHTKILMPELGKLPITAQSLLENVKLTQALAMRGLDLSAISQKDQSKVAEFLGVESPNELTATVRVFLDCLSLMLNQKPKFEVK
jgi:hypothetical protein